MLLPNRFAGTVSSYLYIQVLISITCIFEYVKDFMLEKISINFRPIVQHLFGELTVLGFLAVVVFVINQGGSMDSWSVALYSPEHADSRPMVRACASSHALATLNRGLKSLPS